MSAILHNRIFPLDELLLFNPLEYESLAELQQALYSLDVLALSLLLRDQAEIAQFERDIALREGL